MKRFFCVFTCLFLLLGNHVGYAQDKTNPTDTPKSDSVATDDDKIAPPRPKQNQKSADKKDASGKIGLENLAVQKRMADAAEKANTLTQTQNVIGWIGLALVFITALFAGLAWRAGRDAVNVTRKIGKSQTRAYVHVVKAQFSFSGDVDVVLAIKNTGLTPAKWFEVGAVSKVFPRGEGSQDWKSVDFSEVKKFERWPSLANGHPLTAGAGSDSESDIIRHVIGNEYRQFFLVYGIIRYETMFDEIYETQFAFHSGANISDEAELGRPPIHLQTYKKMSDGKQTNEE